MSRRMSIETVKTKTGLTYTQLAKELDVSLATVATYWKKVGVPPCRRNAVKSIMRKHGTSINGTSFRKPLNPAIGITATEVKFITVIVTNPDLTDKLKVGMITDYLEALGA